MDFSIGTDLVRVDRIRRAAERWGDRFLKRIYSDEELAYCMARAHPWPSLGARFAAKEAFIKAIGLRAPVWREITVINNEEGRPDLFLAGRAAWALGARKTSLSLSHDGEYAIAAVVAFEDGDPQP